MRPPQTNGASAKCDHSGLVDWQLTHSSLSLG
jgi:hypothetical protein